MFCRAPPKRCALTVQGCGAREGLEMSVGSARTAADIPISRAAEPEPPVVGDSVRFGRLLFEVTVVKGHGVEECAVSLLTDVDAGPSEGVGL